jgi:hypothetical protein
MSFPVSYFTSKMEVSIKRYDGLIKVQSSSYLNFQSNFQAFAIRCVIIFVIIHWNWLKFEI